VVTQVERETMLRRAVALHQAGELDDAAAAYEQILASFPDDAHALHLLGTLSERRGDPSRAVELIRHALKLCPDEPAFHTNLGWALRRAGDPVAARAELQRALTLAPEAPQPLFYLGVVEQERGDLEQARRLFALATEAAGTFAEAWLRLGEVERRLGRIDDAVASYRRAVSLAPERLAARLGLARSLFSDRRHDEALQAYGQVLAIAPDHGEALHLRAALAGDDTTAAPAAYVAAVFDACADEFDQLLVKELGYRTPEALIALLTRADGARRYHRALDLGAGTGLCGALLRPLCDELIGVDLSKAMLTQAKRRGDYDSLENGELVQYLETTKLGFDLFVAADTLVYLGALEPCFAAAARRALPDARLAISLENGHGDSHHLSVSGRYTHDPSYVARVAEAHGWAPLGREELTLRREGDQSVRGSLYLFALGHAA
jgi:predicted TPR repeat methyltransferase